MVARLKDGLRSGRSSDSRGSLGIGPNTGGPRMGGRGGGFGRGRSARARLGLLLLTALVLISVDFRSESGSPLSTVRGVVLDVLGPVRSLANWVFSPVGNAWNGIMSYDELEDENARLRAKLVESRSSVLQVGEIERERLELLGLLGAIDTEANIPRVTARVIDAPVSNFERTVEVDRGSRDGVEVGMPVESGAGLIGRVTEVSSTRSRVELLTDPNFDVGIRMVRSGDTGNASGRGAGNDLDVTFIELTTLVLPGETVVTSGLDGSRYPEGLLVGTVVDVQPNAVQDTQDITVHPAAELERLRWVSVILYRPDVEAPIVVDREVEQPSVTAPPLANGGSETTEPEAPPNTLPPTTTVPVTTTTLPRVADVTPEEPEPRPRVTNLRRRHRPSWAE
jgi:rod shape-determining protein MreC